MRVDCIKQLQSFDRRWEWRDVTRDNELLVLNFTRALYPHSHPRCLCSASPVFPTICSFADLVLKSYANARGELRLIRSSWVARRRRHCRLLSAQYWARLLRKVLGRCQYHPILASIGQYPIPQYRYRSNPSAKQTFAPHDGQDESLYWC